MKTLVISAAALALTLGAATAHAAGQLGAADRAAAFKAAGFTQKGPQWRRCDDPSAGYEPGTIAEARDLNGDGRPEAVITEGGSQCYGSTGAGYSLVSKQAGGGWKLMSQGTGMLTRARHERRGRVAGHRDRRTPLLFPGRALERQTLRAPSLPVRGQALPAAEVRRRDIAGWKEL